MVSLSIQSGAIVVCFSPTSRVLLCTETLVGHGMCVKRLITACLRVLSRPIG